MKRAWSVCLASSGIVALAILRLNAVSAEVEEIENATCLECHSDKDLTKETAAGATMSLYVDEALLQQSPHRTNSCVSCHTDIKSTHPDDEAAPQPVNCSQCHQRHSESYGASVHGEALRSGELSAPTCKDCHGSHDVLPPSSERSPLYRANLAATCGECHPEVTAEVQESVHGAALVRGVREAPTCTDCHFEHKIEKLQAAAPLKIAEKVCSQCHASERMNTKYNLPSDRVQTFFASYHGLAARFGSTEAANCASCHGVHGILPSSDPRSMVHPNNLVTTCGKCHPGATENFAQGKVHVNREEAADVGELINLCVRRGYIGLIVVVIGSLLVHNLLLWRTKLVAARRVRERTVVRMTSSQRIQHFILFLSFTVLAVTGFALEYPNSWLAWLLGSDETFRRLSHRMAAVILLGLGGYHVAYWILKAEGRQLLKALLPTKKDARDVKTNVAYLTGRSAEKAKFGRFSYIEKVEYWAVVWGTVIMGVTGLMIWFKIDVTQFLPRWAVDVATTIHFYEAILAILAICVWHFYFVIFDPDVYPLNWACWDGKVNREWYQEEHPLHVLDEAEAPVAAGKKRFADASASTSAGAVWTGDGI